MAKFVVITVGVRGHTNRCIEFARRAESLGHEIVFGCQNLAVKETIKTAGFEFIELESGTDGATFGGLGKRLLNLGAYRRSVAAKQNVLRQGAGLPEYLQANKPDAVLLDSELQELTFIAARYCEKVTLIEFHASPLRYEGAPPLSSDLVPTFNTWSNLKSKWAWWKLRGRRFASRLWRGILLGRYSKHATIKSIARDSHLDWRQWLSLSQWQVYFFKELHYLCFSAPEFDFAFPPAKRTIHFLGPMVLKEQPKYTYEFKSQWKRWKYRDSELPLIVVSSGSVLKRRGFCAAVTRAIVGKKVRVVMNYPGSDLDHLGDLPENILVSGWIPQARLLREASLCICHGGMATTQESLSAGVPLLVYSAGVMDQNGNGARVAFHGLGLSRQRYTDKVISDDIDLVLSQSKYTVRAQEFSRILADYNDQDLLADALTQVLQS